MYEILIRIPGRDEIKARLIPGTYRVGSSPASHLTLNASGVVPRHCLFTATDTDLKIADLGGGIEVDGEAFHDTTVHIRPGSRVRIGEAEILALGTEDREERKPEPPKPVSAPPPPAPAQRPLNNQGKHEIPILAVSGIPLAARPFVQEIKRLAHIELLKRLNLKRMVLAGTAQGDLEKKAKDTIHEIISELTVTLPAGVTTDKIERELVHEAIGLGPLEDLIAMPEIPPLSLIGPTITIRKFSRNPLQIDDLVRFGSISYEMADFLNVCVKLRKNIIISGGTGSGKTTLLNILSSFLPDTERIITIEDAAELQLRQDHVVRLESRPANIEGKGEVNIRDLVRNSLRMRPDRIVIGECRGGEALDMLQAMNTGHDGSLTTIHANTPRDALSRLETLVLMAGFDLPLRAIREQIASAIAIIVQINREKDGTRKVTNISEITRMEGDMITMQDIFTYHQDGWDANGKMTGRHIPSGNLPSFMEDIKRAGLKLDLEIFTRGMLKGEER